MKPKKETWCVGAEFIGQRVTVEGYHRNYRPVLAEITDGMARLQTPELPGGGEAHWVKVTALEAIR